MKSIIILFVMVWLLLGCGQKGDLFLPPANPNHEDVQHQDKSGEVKP